MERLGKRYNSLDGTMIIYKATNLVNGRIYIGQTIEPLRKRLTKHLCEANGRRTTYFHKALHKYGIENFKWQVICICPNINSLNAQESYYIAHYQSNVLNVGYNLTSGGDNCQVSDETKRTKQREK